MKTDILNNSEDRLNREIDVFLDNELNQAYLLSHINTQITNSQIISKKINTNGLEYITFYESKSAKLVIVDPINLLKQYLNNPIIYLPQIERVMKLYLVFKIFNGLNDNIAAKYLKYILYLLRKYNLLSSLLSSALEINFPNLDLNSEYCIYSGTPIKSGVFKDRKSFSSYVKKGNKFIDSIKYFNENLKGLENTLIEQQVLSNYLHIDEDLDLSTETISLNENTLEMKNFIESIDNFALALIKQIHKLDKLNSSKSHTLIDGYQVTNWSEIIKKKIRLKKYEFPYENRYEIEDFSFLDCLLMAPKDLVDTAKDEIETVLEVANHIERLALPRSSSKNDYRARMQRYYEYILNPPSYNKPIISKEDPEYTEYLNSKEHVEYVHIVPQELVFKIRLGESLIPEPPVFRVYYDRKLFIKLLNSLLFCIKSPSNKEVRLINEEQFLFNEHEILNYIVSAALEKSKPKDLPQKLTILIE